MHVQNKSKLIISISSICLVGGMLAVAPAEAVPHPDRGSGHATANGAPATRAGLHSATRAVAAGGKATAKYLGKVRLADLPRATAAQVKTNTSHPARRVPNWFQGSQVGAQLSKSGSPRPLVTTPTVVRLNIGGTKGPQSSCGCQPPDTNGAVNATRIVETVNLSMAIYQRGGALVSRTSLASFFPTAREISDPRIQFDNAAKRWVLTFIPVPTSTTDTPTMFLAASTSADPSGSWLKYTLTFSGSLFPSGTLLDYPMLGQDANAFILGTNNFQLGGGGFSYINSTAFAVPKAAIYAGSGFSFPAFPVAFSTHPAVARGKPIVSYSKSYLMAANSSGGFTLYYMQNTAGTPTMTLQGTTANSLWSPPPKALQPAPNSSAQLDTLDGRLQAAPIQADGALWFAHAAALGGFPAVQYGELDLSTSGTGGVSAPTAWAYESGTSYDWNPSIGLAQTSAGVRIFLNWAVTDPTNGQNVTQRVSGVGPGQGIPALIGIGTNLFTGGGASSQSRFGDYSSVSMDVKNVSTTCKWNKQAVVVNEVFNSNDWQARIAQVGFC